MKPSIVGPACCLFTLGFYCVTFITGNHDMSNSAKNQKPMGKQETAFQMQALKRELTESGRAYSTFLNVPTMHCGVYHLEAGEKDKQQPHEEDEVYYVESGKAKFHHRDRDIDVRPGTVLFVPAHEEHRFHSIEEDLTLLVFFSKAPPKQSNSSDQ